MSLEFLKKHALKILSIGEYNCICEQKILSKKIQTIQKQGDCTCPVRFKQYVNLEPSYTACRTVEWYSHIGKVW